MEDKIKPLLSKNQKISILKKIKFKYWNIQEKLSIYGISDFIESVKRIFYFFPIIWKDRMYDYSGYNQLLLRRAKYQLKYFQKESRGLDFSDDIKSLERFVFLLQKINDDLYSDYVIQSLRIKYPYYEIGFKNLKYSNDIPDELIDDLGDVRNYSEIVHFDIRTGLELDEINEEEYRKVHVELMKKAEEEKKTDLIELSEYWTEQKIYSFWN